MDLKSLPKDFEPVQSVDQVGRYLLEGARTFCPVFVWTPGQEMSFQTNLSSFRQKESQIGIKVPPDFDPGKFMDFLAEKNITDCFFSVTLSRAILFFKTRFVSLESDSIQFLLPDKVFKVQRRKDLRFQIPQGYVLKVDIQEPLTTGTNHIKTKKIIDISAGGLAILVPDAEASAYLPGTLLTLIQMTIRSKVIKCQGEIMHARAVPEDFKDKNFKIGISFRNISASDAELIAAYVFEENRKYLARFM